MGVDVAGHREGEGGTDGGDNGSDLHGLSPSALRSLFVLHCFLTGIAGPRTPNGVNLAGVKSTRAPVDNEHRERGEHATAARAITVWNSENG
jgi:hypothetical protein